MQADKGGGGRSSGASGSSISKRECNGGDSGGKEHAQVSAKVVSLEEPSVAGSVSTLSEEVEKLERVSEAAQTYQRRWVEQAGIRTTAALASSIRLRLKVKTSSPVCCTACSHTRAQIFSTVLSIYIITSAKASTVLSGCMVHSLRCSCFSAE